MSSTLLIESPKYLSKPMPKFYYDEIKKTWLYGECGIEQEQRPLEKVYSRADFIIRYVKNGQPKKVVLMENERRGYETQSSWWAEAVRQLTDYLKLVRAEQDWNDTLYAAVTIGTYVRFYYLEPKEQTLTDYTTVRTGDYYELKKDEAEVHKVLNEWVEKTSH
ncbi:hypothetical protein H112_01684 [Trichophyton rubrum D6]|uniref:Uncharacterized protein n=2 Tax=Trichophyton TaxID=5550 RepID=A0A022WCD2_TRIRU|nr:hypothetical protein H100_01680 [Trichophyton rubrum MR850]EZF45153.1 hypothetical protein H102_01672 [Trichophyton rubrum CBS 100081]EZF55786.1 hypothetical protein H103_01686 [Trichophyton rubrum CBS 288.86]EZF66401.1 hypothetical protein H104_01661 [Trichophyton rubrum CBS 289.86]EZF77042.1 hypothetical protein H105_01688 [Trichophyton soudanense CBS 452.61]EZF87695.1 hypothetical protein H110_01684 [Trichophyton rubrum MR1448]EZF98499.1 hypothetical protein H113_01683 [Trichophyton rub